MGLFNKYKDTMSSSYSKALYTSMVNALVELQKADPTLKPSGMAAILVLRMRTDYIPNDDSISFTHKKSGRQLFVEPTSTFNEVIWHMAQLELNYLIPTDIPLQRQVYSSLRQLMQEGDSSLGSPTPNADEN